MDPAKFRAYLEAEIGKREADLATVSPGKPHGGQEGNQNASGNEADMVSASSEEAQSDAERRKNERLRAILRAPEIVQDLYKAGLMTQLSDFRQV